MVRPPPTEPDAGGQQPGRTPLQEHLRVEPVHGDQLRRRPLLEGVCPIDQDQRALAGLLPAEPQGPHAPTPSPDHAADQGGEVQAGALHHSWDSGCGR